MICVFFLLLAIFSLPIKASDCSCIHAYDPVCDNLGIMHENLCWFECEKLTKPGLQRTWLESCREESDADWENKCLTVCDKTIDYQCGSDGKTYQVIFVIVGNLLLNSHDSQVFLLE